MRLEGLLKKPALVGPVNLLPFQPLQRESHSEVWRRSIQGRRGVTSLYLRRIRFGFPEPDRTSSICPAYIGCRYAIFMALFQP